MKQTRNKNNGQRHEHSAILHMKYAQYMFAHYGLHSGFWWKNQSTNLYAQEKII